MTFPAERIRRLIAILVLIFLISVAALLWFIDLLKQQRVFGFMLSAGFVAFAMLVYLYSKNTFAEVSKLLLYLGSLALLILGLLSIGALMVG